MRVATIKQPNTEKSALKPFDSGIAIFFSLQNTVFSNSTIQATEGKTETWKTECSWFVSFFDWEASGEAESTSSLKDGG